MHGQTALKLLCYFDNKDSLILAVNIETEWIFTLAPPGYRAARSVLTLYVTCRIEQRFAEFIALTEIVLVSHLSTRETVPACAVEIALLFYTYAKYHALYYLTCVHHISFGICGEIKQEQM